MQDFKALFQNRHPRFLLPLILTLLWCVVDLVSLFWGGFYGINAYWVIGLLAKLAMLVINAWFIREFFHKSRQELYWVFRKYVGYAVVLGYGAINLPIMSWQNDGLVTQMQATFLWVPCGIQVVLMMALWLTLRVKKSMVFWEAITAKEAADKKLLQQNLRSKKRSLAMMVLENVDMFIQTVFIVIVLQLFLVQLYVIPSESMVPTMLKQDRPLVLKTLDGPTIPMTSIKLPELINIDRGQIVVFESPAYTNPPLAIKVVQEFIFYLTLSLVNLDKDENGNPKVHFVVKRVTGVPGEKLMMVDDVLYVKTAADKDFYPQEQDKAFRHTDFLDQSPSVQARIEDTPKVSAEEKTQFLDLDTQRRSLDFSQSGKNLMQSTQQLRQELSLVSPVNIAAFDLVSFQNDPMLAARLYKNLIPSDPLASYQPWQEGHFEILDVFGYEQTIIRHVLVDTPDREAFLKFLETLPNMGQTLLNNPYQKACAALDIMTKQLMAERYLFLAQRIRQNSIGKDFDSDKVGQAISSRSQNFKKYMHSFDNRNFPEYPDGANEYIPQGKYFLMGDNRYNSLDFRFDERGAIPGFHIMRNLAPTDPQSIVYQSILGPRLLDRSRIIGHVMARLWPIDRFGPISP